MPSSRLDWLDLVKTRLSQVHVLYLAFVLSDFVFEFSICIFGFYLEDNLNASLFVNWLSAADLEIDSSDESGDLGFSKWTQIILGKPGVPSVLTFLYSFSSCTLDI